MLTVCHQCTILVSMNNDEMNIEIIADTLRDWRRKNIEIITDAKIDSWYRKLARLRKRRAESMECGGDHMFAARTGGKK